MKLKKIIAAVAAAAVAVSAMAINTFALAATDYLKDGTVYINANKAEDPNWSADSGVAVTDVYGVTYHVEFDASEVANDSTWIGGGIGANSPSTSWKQIEWGRSDKEILADLDNGTITWLSDSPVFAADDIYAQFWLQTWGGTVTIKSADILGKDGVILSTDDAPVAEAETEAATEEDAAEPEEEADEPEEEEAEPDDVDVDEEEDIDVDEDVDVDADVEEDAPETTEAAVADATTTPAKTGNVAVASIAAVMALAGAAAIASRKRK